MSVFSLGVLLLLMIGCSEDTEGTDRHAAVEPCSVSPPNPQLEAMTPRDVVADCLWAACPYSSRAPPHSRSF
jgi:hypothetical protein